MPKINSKNSRKRDIILKKEENNHMNDHKKIKYKNLFFYLIIFIIIFIISLFKNNSVLKLILCLISIISFFSMSY